MKRILTLTAAWAGMGTLQAADSPSLEACVQYAEADHAHEVAIREPRAVYEVALQEAEAVREAALQEAWAVYEVALQEAEAVREAALQEPKAALGAVYLAIYAEDDGVQSDVPVVMMKLRNRHRERCRELHGL